MKETRHLVAALVLAASLPAQDLIDWSAWKPGKNIHSLTLSATKGASLDPRATLGDRATITQTIDVPSNGWRLLHLSGYAWDDAHDAIIDIGTQRVIDESTWGQLTQTKPVFLAKGRHVLTFETNALPAGWVSHWRNLRVNLTPLVLPVTSVDGCDGGNTFLSLSISATANIMAASIKTTAPIRLPGVAGSLLLDPSSLTILATSVTAAKMHLDLGSLLNRAKLTDWPTFYVQSATWTRIGSVSTVQGR